jgi:hypothetical protein
VSAGTLYRAVSLAEAEDIRTTGAFRCIPCSMETKLFVATELAAVRLGRYVLYRIDSEPIFIATVSLPEDLYETLLVGVFRSGFPNCNRRHRSA